MGPASHRVGRDKAQCVSCRMRPRSRPWTRGCRSGKRSSSPEAPQLGSVTGKPWRAQLCDWTYFLERGHRLGGFSNLFSQYLDCFLGLGHILLLCRLF